jgi:hypothetical protein
VSTGSLPARVSYTPLKHQNSTALMVVLGANLAVLVLAIKTDSLFSYGLDQLIQQWRGLLPAGVGVIVAGVANGLLSSNAKARLVFWRWSNPLPASFAFSYYVERDTRIDVGNLRKRVGPFPSEPREQNTKWYSLYKSVSNEPAVLDAHRNFLLMRDYAGVAFLLLPIAGAIGFWQIPSLPTASLYAVLLLAQYLLARHVERNHGIRFVTTVLALKAAG